MTAENFEKYAKNKLGGYRSEVDAEAMWAAVSTELAPKKKNRFFGIWFFTGLLVMSIIGSLALQAILNQTPDPIPSSSTAALSIDGKNKTEPINTKYKTDQTNQYKTDQTNLSVETKSNVSIDNSLDITLATNLKNSSKVISPIEDPIQVNTTDIRTSGSPLMEMDDTNYIGSNINVFSENQPKTFMSTSQYIELVDTLDLGDEKNARSPSMFSPTTSEDEPLYLEEEEEEEEEEELEEFVESIMIEEPMEEEEEFEVLKKSTPSSFSSFSRDLTIGFGLRGGLASTLTQFDTFDGKGDTIRDLRFNSETSLETFSVGLEALVKHDIGFYVSLGADYSKYTRRMDFDSQLEFVDSVQGVTKIYINPITMVETYDSGLVARTTTYTSVKEIYNTNEFINIPVTLGYAFGYDNWSIGLEAGALININANMKGLIRDSENTFYDISKDERNWFRNNIGVSFRGALVLGYSFDDSFQIYFGPEFRSPVRIDDKFNPVRQEQTSLGFQLGARYWLAY